MKIFKDWTRRDWIAVVSFCALAFFGTNDISIRGGGCEYSVCSSLDDSSFDGMIGDHYFEADSLPLYAPIFFRPISLLAKNYFGNDPQLQIEIYEDSLAVDTKSELEDKMNSYQLLKNDSQMLPRIFFVYFVLTLFIVPVWLVAAIGLRFLTKQKNPWVRRAGAFLFWFGIVIFGLTFLLARSFVDFSTGEPRATATFLWHALVK